MDDASGDPDDGNIRGLPDDHDARTSSSRCSRASCTASPRTGGEPEPVGQPGAAFVVELPALPSERRHPRAGTVGRRPRSCSRMPHTGTIGGMATFYFTFVYSQPYRAADPERRRTTAGARTSTPSQSACNRRCSSTGSDIHDFVDDIRRGRGTRRLRGSAGAPRDRCRRMPTINPSSGLPAASSSEPLVGLL